LSFTIGNVYLKMKERNQYTEIEDFLSDKSFRLWVKSKEDLDGWEEWTLEYPYRAKLVEEARLWQLAMKVPDNNLTDEQIEKALHKTWIKIEQREEKQDFKNNRLWKNNLLRKIAVVFIFSLLSWYTFNYYIISKVEYNSNYEKAISNDSDGLIEQINNSNKPQIITLSDGSSILLQPKSKLSYPNVFKGDIRKVYLSGEAFFEITKNKKKPFFVIANEIVTKVVGTSFRIKANVHKSDVEVLVRTGKVMVYSKEKRKNDCENKIILFPNQAFRFIDEDKSFNKITDITLDESISKMKGNIEQLSFDFTDIPVGQIFKTIEQAYSVEIDYPKEKLKNCHLTASLNDLPLPEKLKIICKSIANNCSYTMNGNQITIISEGCY